MVDTRATTSVWMDVLLLIDVDYFFNRLDLLGCCCHCPHPFLLGPRLCETEAARLRAFSTASDGIAATTPRVSVIPAYL